MSSPRERAVDAAIDLLGTEGLRALTHRRVDEAAGLPPGSTSNYFRTRQALLRGVADGILGRELAGMGAAFSPRSADDLVDAFVALLERTTEEQRTLTSARLALFMEASHEPTLRETLGQGRSMLETAVRSMLADLGARDPASSARALMACAEGLILHRVARHDDAAIRPVVDLVVRAALA
ncbi:TetR family transcriptional regulator [Rothia sp. ARF10]|nr:TetR family transcriptional regulator [Rothia sp. ARF10]